jgi:hypothetical protein
MIPKFKSLELWVFEDFLRIGGFHSKNWQRTNGFHERPPTV